MPTESRLADFTRVPTEPIPLSVLTGFLGSGKTTFLSRVLAVPDLEDTAMIGSEFGAVALDHLDHVSRPDFVVRDLEPDEILRRFAAGEPACLTHPAGAS
jgi:hypothetical protein